jgi:hypothetical protein
MATIKLTAYATADSVLTTELNSLATATNSSASAAVDNSSDRYPFADVELVVDHAANPSAGGLHDIYILAAVDGTNFPDTAHETGERWASIPVAANTNVQRVTRQGRFPIPPCQFKLFLRNVSGQALVASGNTLTIFRYGLESV